MPIKKNKKSKAVEAANNKLNSKTMLDKILPEIKALFVDPICSTNTGTGSAAYDHGFDSKFSDFMKGFFGSNDILAWVRSLYNPSDAAGVSLKNKRMDRLFADIVAYSAAARVDEQSDLGIFLAEYISLITVILPKQMQDRNYSVLSHVLACEPTTCHMF